MILKRKTQNATSLKLLLIFFLIPAIFKAQNTIPTTTVSGCLHVDSTMSTGNLDVGGSGRIDSSLVVGDTMKAQDIIVTGNARIAGDVNLGGKLLYDATQGIGFKSGLGVAPDIFTLGKLGDPVPPVNPCLVATMDPWFNVAMRVKIFDPTSNVALTMGSDGVQSHIDASGNNGLLMNYYCGKDIIMCTGANGGAVFTGDKFRARKNVQIGPHWQTLDPNVALDVYANGMSSVLKLWSGAVPTVKLIHDNYDQFMVMGNGKTSIGVNATVGAAPYKTLTVNGDASFANYGNSTDGLNAFEIIGDAGLNKKPLRRGISVDKDLPGLGGKVNFYIHDFQPQASFNFKNGNGDKTLVSIDANGKLGIIAYGNTAFQIADPMSDQIKFIVKNNGQTFIGDKTPLASGPHGNAKLAVDGKILAKEIFVNIHNSVWPDYVFKKSYTLAPLSEVEAYYTKNSHLKGVPSAKDIMENGINTAEMFTIFLQKIEDLTLYTVAQDKRIEKLEKEKEEMKAQIKSLQKN